LKKTVKISDEAYMKSIKSFFTNKKIDFADELSFMIENDMNMMRLSDLKSALASFGVF